MNKVCLINPPTTLKKEYLYFPMGLVSLGTFLKKERIPVEIVDFDLLNRFEPSWGDDFERFKQGMLEKLVSTQADIFGITSICSNFPLALTMAGEIRKRWPCSKIVFGGPQPSLVAETLLKEFSYVDAVVIGEGEKTFVELLQSSWAAQDLKKIRGIAFREGDSIHRTPSRPLIDDLDELPLPDFSLVDLACYLRTSNVPVVEAGRGCPFLCSFCSTAPMWERKFRIKSPKRILEEMDFVHRNYGLRSFEFIHDNFTTHRKYNQEFCEYFIENNREKLIWYSSARTDTLHKEDLGLFKGSGCGGFFFGVDSGSVKIQKVIDKDLDLQEFKVILTETLSRGMCANVSLIIGFPEETREDLDQTIELGLWSKTLNPQLVHVYYHRLSPLAGSPIYLKNKDNIFREKKNSSDISCLPFDVEALWAMIETYPALFSSFYSLPTPNLAGINLFDLSRHYSELVNRCATSFSWLIKKKDVTPVRIYEEWKRDHPAVARSAYQDYTPVFENFCEYL